MFIISNVDKIMLEKNINKITKEQEQNILQHVNKVFQPISNYINLNNLKDDLSNNLIQSF